MQLSGDALLLRIFISENDRYKGETLYEAIVLEAKRLGLAGATVLRGILGFGASSCIHSAKILELSQELPVVVELVDLEKNIVKIMPFIDENVHGGLVTLEKIKILKYAPHKVKA